MQINGKRIDDPKNAYVIAEASGNHNQNLQQARALVQAAATAGASACKFQTFTASEICADVPILFGHDAQHDAWVKKLGVSRMRQLFSKGGLPREWHKDLKREAEDLGIEFLSTPFSIDAAKFLVEEIGVRALKIASGDLTFTPLLQYAASTGLPLLVSTGGATMDEVDTALRVCIQEWRSHPDIYPSEDIVLMHCVSIYPCPDIMTNLLAIRTMEKRFGAVGFSDHTLSTDLIPALAVSLGASCFEKHLRLSTDTESVDVSHSLDPEQFHRYVETLRTVPYILGDGIKKPHPREAHDRLWARRDTSDWLRPTRDAREGFWSE